MYGRPRHHRRRGGGNAGGLFVMLMLWQQLQRLPVKPPLTIALIVLQVYLHYGGSVALLGRHAPVSAVCLQPEAMLSGHNTVVRATLSQLLHGDDMHLYYNMASFAWKGAQLEPAMGVANYAVLLVYMVVACAALVVGLAVAAAETAVMPGLMAQCAVGFSAVIFGLKTVLNLASPSGASTVYGMRVPTKYAAWAELVIIQVLVPNASFVGHLAGILAGLLWHYALRHHVPDLTPLAGESNARSSAGGDERFY